LKETAVSAVAVVVVVCAYDSATVGKHVDEVGGANETATKNALIKERRVRSRRSAFIIRGGLFREP